MIGELKTFNTSLKLKLKKKYYFCKKRYKLQQPEKMKDYNFANRAFRETNISLINVYCTTATDVSRRAVTTRGLSLFLCELQSFTLCNYFILICCAMWLKMNTLEQTELLFYILYAQRTIFYTILIEQNSMIQTYKFRRQIVSASVLHMSIGPAVRLQYVASLTSLFFLTIKQISF